MTCRKSQEYKVIARRYRPQKFEEVLGQEATVTTLRHALAQGRMAQAYLFSGPRGTGKTTLARVLAKALNCVKPQEGEPCNQCPSCLDIASGHSLDVLEIDGASHRGIEDIRQINETVSYAASHGNYRIYIIDEVHMLTKEAFNALLKTLEEPPERVKFFFATTEPHKVPSTILSRCQCFTLNRIAPETIVAKLGKIAEEMHSVVKGEALALIAKSAQGGLRDAESLLDQILAFVDSPITEDAVRQVLGLTPKEWIFALDEAGKSANFKLAFELSDKLFKQGKHLGHFMTHLMEHIRHILAYKLAGPSAIPPEDVIYYERITKDYKEEQCLYLMDYLLEASERLKTSPSPKIVVEAALLHFLKSHQRVSIDALLARLEALRQGKMSCDAVDSSAKEVSKSEILEHATPLNKKTPSVKEVTRTASQDKPATYAEEMGARLPEEAKADVKKRQSRYDTLVRFAAVELEGTLGYR